MTKIVNVEVQTVAQSFPVGTVDTLYGYVVVLATGGEPVATKESTETSAQFTLDAGDYVVTVTKNGVAASAAFTVAVDTVSLNVPATVVVTFV
jgi:hypothetical protein